MQEMDRELFALRFLLDQNLSSSPHPEEMLYIHLLNEHTIGGFLAERAGIAAKAEEDQTLEDYNPVDVVESCRVLIETGGITILEVMSPYAH